jgi:hypothetical protein
MASSMNLYQLEYSYKSSWANLTKRRSFFYRPEHISNVELWKALRNGSEIETIENDEAQAAHDLRKRMLKKASKLDSYR